MDAPASIDLHHKPGQRQAFLDYLESELGLRGNAATTAVLDWVRKSSTYSAQYHAVSALMRAHQFHLRDDRVLYAFCEAKGFPAPAMAFHGSPDVGDFLADFAEKNATGKLIQLQGRYEVHRLGSYRVRYGKEDPHGQSVQSYGLVIDVLDKQGTNARFRYFDLGQTEPTKPKDNQWLWQGRVVATHDAVYLVGTSKNAADAAMLILWQHPASNDILVGVQLAKLAPLKSFQDRSDYTIARRVAAIRRRRGVNRGVLRQLATAWIELDPTGAYIPIDQPEIPASNCE